MRLLLLALTTALATPALAEDALTWTSTDPVDDVVFAVENAIVGAGLVIEHRSVIGEMLDRTKADVGGTKDIFTRAEVFTFCSAQFSRQVMEADPANIQFCPYGIFVYETKDKPGEVVVGHRNYPEGDMQVVEDMLTGIVKDALMID